MAKLKEEGIVRYVGREIRKEAKRQLRGFGDAAFHQASSGWGAEFARQIFGGSRRRRRSR